MSFCSLPGVCHLFLVISGAFKTLHNMTHNLGDEKLIHGFAYTMLHDEGALSMQVST